MTLKGTETAGLPMLGHVREDSRSQSVGKKDMTGGAQKRSGNGVKGTGRKPWQGNNQHIELVMDNIRLTGGR